MVLKPSLKLKLYTTKLLRFLLQKCIFMAFLITGCKFFARFARNGHQAPHITNHVYAHVLAMLLSMCNIIVAWPIQDYQVKTS